MKVNWSKPGKPVGSRFKDLAANQAFRNKAGYGAVYVKVLPAGGIEVVDSNGNDVDGLMFEVATGKLYPPTAALVELVDVEVNVGTNKPNLKGY